MSIGSSSSKKVNLYLGIDPGANGGMALIDSRRRVIFTQRMPPMGKPRLIIEQLRVVTNSVTVLLLESGLPLEGGKLRITLEKVGGYMPGSGGNIGSRMFSFGEQYGMVKMALAAEGLLKYTKGVQPAIWQKYLGLVKDKPRVKKPVVKGRIHKAPTYTPKPLGDILPLRKKVKDNWKNMLKDHAIKLFPDTKVTSAVADALLLAEYCRFINEGKFRP